MKKLVMLVLICFSLYNTVYTQPEPRSVNWVHGFVGDGDSWKDFDEYFTGEYNFNSRRIEYPSKLGIETCATIAMEQLITDGDNPIAITHSMGGLVARKMIEMGADLDGYVSFGTPHQGAYFANSYTDGDVDLFTSEFVEEVFVDIIQAFLTPFTATIKDRILQLFGYNNPYLVGNLVFRFIKYFILQQTDEQTISDMEVEGEFLNELQEPILPKVDFYGIEDSPVHWRFLGNFVYGADADDNILVKKMDKLNQFYETVHAISLATSSTCLSFPVILVPGCALLGMYAGNLASQLQQAVMFLDGSEAYWLALIGAIGESQEVCYTDQYLVGYDYNGDGVYNSDDKELRDSCIWNKMEGSTMDSIVISLDIACDPKDLNEDKAVLLPDPCRDFIEIFEEKTICFDIPVELPNDGFIVYHTTQEDNPDAWVEVRNLNHQQLKNHVKSKQLIDELFQGNFNGDNSIIDFFRLKAKN